MKANIEEMTALVMSAQTATVEGRQIISDNCEKLYMAIEEDVHNAGCDWMLKGMYDDLCNGNFAEPFMCEQKKSIFASVVEVYNTRILPRL